MNLKFYPILALLFSAFTTTNAQNILLVDDVAGSSMIFDNIDKIITALDAAEYDYFLFDAAGTGASPTIEELEPFDVVLWYTGTDGAGLQLWNGNDTDNPALIEYLDGGGSLFLMGADFLYDRYGTAPDTFGTEDFVNKYLGIEVYKAQSYGDDGNLGVPQLEPTPETELFFDFDTLRFIFATLWHVDALVPNENAGGAFAMGPESYPLAGEYAAIGYESDNFFTFTAAFDPGQIDSQENINNFIFQIVRVMVALSTSVDEVQAQTPAASLVPRGQEVTIPIKETHYNQNLLVLDTQGRIVNTQKVTQSTAQIPTDHLKSGMYYTYLKGEVHRFVVVE